MAWIRSDAEQIRARCSVVQPQPWQGIQVIFWSLDLLSISPNVNILLCT